MCLYLILGKDDNVIDVFHPDSYDCKFTDYFYHYYNDIDFRWIKIDFAKTFNKSKGDLIHAVVFEVSNG